MRRLLQDPADAECISKRQCIEEHAASEDEGGQALYDDGFIVDGSHHDEDDVIEPHLEQQKHKVVLRACRTAGKIIVLSDGNSDAAEYYKRRRRQ